MEYVKITIKELREIMFQASLKLGVQKKHINLVIDNYLRAEISGKATHGIAKFIFESQFFKDRIGPPKIIKDSNLFALVDANKEIGQVSAKFCTNLCVKRAKKYGVGVVGMFNSQRYGTLDVWSEEIASKDLIGIVINTCESETTVYGGVSKILGTNPLSYSIPTMKEPITLDMATSKVAISLMWESRRLKRTLPPNTFYDKKGRYTTNPFKAVAVKHFGGYKGFGISLLIQILTGSFLGLPMATEIKSLYDIGYLFVAVDPSKFQNISGFKEQNSKLVQIIKSSQSKEAHEIKIPGERSRKLREKNLKRGYIKIDLDLYNKLVSLSKPKTSN